MNDNDNKTSSKAPYSISLSGNSTAGPSNTSSARKRVRFAEDQTSINKHHTNDNDNKTSSKAPHSISLSPVSQQNDSSELKRKYKKIKRRILDKPSIARAQEIKAMKVFQDAIAKALGISTDTGASGTDTQIASTSVPSTSLAGNLQATSTSSSVRKRTYSSSSSSSSEEELKRKYKMIKRRTLDKPSIARAQEIKAMKVFQHSIAKALGISTDTGASGTDTEIASTSVPSTSLAGNLQATSTSSSVRKRTYSSSSSSSEEEPRNKKKHRKDKETQKKDRKRSTKTKKSSRRRTFSQPRSSSQQQADFKVFQDAIAKPLGLSTSAPVTSPTSAPATMTVAKDTNTITSSSSLVIKKNGLEHQNNTGNSKGSQPSSSNQQQASTSNVSLQNNNTGNSKGSQPSSSNQQQTSTSTVSLQNNNTGNIGGNLLPATDTRIMPNIHSAQQQQHHHFMNSYQYNLQNNVTVPQNPSTTTRGIYEYITLHDRERAIRAHQQQMVLQQQMKYLRESPYSVQQESPLFRNPITETRKRKFDTNLADVASWNPKRFRLSLSKGPKVHPKALDRKPDAQKRQGKEDCASDDIFPPSSVFMARLRERAPRKSMKETLRVIKSQQSEKKEDSPTN